MHGPKHNQAVYRLRLVPSQNELVLGSVDKISGGIVRTHGERFINADLDLNL